MDIVRPPLEDFQPIALRLRLALLGIYIKTRHLHGDGVFFIRSVRRRFSICAARAGEAFAASASAEAFPEQEKQDGDGREGCNPAEVRKLRPIVAPFFFLFHLQGALHGIIEMLDALLPLVERLLFSLLFCLLP